MADYTPPLGSAVHLALGGTYTPPVGSAVPLDLSAAGLAVRFGRRCNVGGRWGTTAARRRHEPALRWIDPPRRAVAPAAAWAAPERRRGTTAAAWVDAAHLRVETGAAWTDAQRLRAETGAAWTDAQRRRHETGEGWTAGERLRRELASNYTHPPRRRLAVRITASAAAPLRADTELPYRYPERHSPGWRIPWNQSTRVRWEERWAKGGLLQTAWSNAGALEVYWTPPPGNAVPLPLQCSLLDWPGYAVWLFLREAPCPPFQRRRVWHVTNSLCVVRLPDRTAVPVLGASLSSDYDSWAWGVSLTLPDRATLALVSPVGGSPVAVEITLNGYVWTAVVESFEERREFGKAGFTVTGRSRSAVLAAPDATARSFELGEPRTAVQLAEAELLGSGWAVVWDTVDWAVPAGAFAYSGKTPLEAVGLVAGAVGAVLQSDRWDDVLRVLPRYPLSPWEWAAATPDATLTDSLARTLELRWQQRPPWQGVYVSGQSQGVLCRVKRTGSDGTPTAALLVDPLLTHVDAGRERGRQVLAAAGRWASVTVELPLLASPDEPGLLAVGQLVEVNDGVDVWRGLVTRVALTAGLPSVRQTVELERYYGL